jgi:thiol-disulfide isomerase/thioredoxin
MIMRTWPARVLALLLPLLVASPAFAAMPAQPALQVTTLDGRPWNLAAQRGHWVIVNFWATWCVPCIREMPDISAFVGKHANVRAIGLAYDDSPADQIRAFLTKHPVVYPVAQVPLDHPPKDFDAPQGLPTTWLIAPDGRVAKRFIGPIDAATLGRAIQAGH